MFSPYPHSYLHPLVSGKLCLHILFTCLQFLTDGESTAHVCTHSPPATFPLPFISLPPPTVLTFCCKYTWISRAPCARFIESSHDNGGSGRWPGTCEPVRKPRCRALKGPPLSTMNLETRSRGRQVMHAGTSLNTHTRTHSNRECERERQTDGEREGAIKRRPLPLASLTSRWRARWRRKEGVSEGGDVCVCWGEQEIERKEKKGRRRNSR